jgi:flagellar biosynthesis protein FlhG
MTTPFPQKKGTVVAVTSGKGGVGKTNVAVNLAVALARLGRSVALIDADFGLGNVDALLGLAPQHHIGHVLNADKALEDIVVSGPAGVQIVPAASGLRTMNSLNTMQRQRLSSALGRLRRSAEFLLIDTASGIADNVVDILQLADRVLLVTSREPSAVVDAYATAKVASASWPRTELGVVVNGVRDAQEAGLAFRQLDVASLKFLGRSLKYYGFVADDQAVREATLAHRPVVEHDPQSAASRCFRILAARIAGMGPAPGLAVRIPTGLGQVPPPEVSQCA